MPFPFVPVFLLLIAASVTWAGESPKILHAYLGKPPIVDGAISEGEYDDAISFTHPNGWTRDPGARTDASDLSVKGWIKHDGKALYFAFDVADSSLCPAPEPGPPAGKSGNTARANASPLTGFPVKGDGISLALNTTNEWSQRDAETSRGDDASWQLFALLGNESKARVFPFVPQEPRAQRGAQEKYRSWLSNGAQNVVIRPKSDARGYIIEWSVRFDPCLKVEANEDRNRRRNVVPDRFWDPGMGRITMGLNIGIQDCDRDGTSGDASGSVRHSDWWTGEKGKTLWLKEWGSLVLNPGRKPWELYVAPDGEREAKGTVERPFRTLAQAQNAVRSMNRNMDRDIIVHVKGGNHSISEPLRFSAADSGTNGFKVIYTGDKEESPAITGGIDIVNWTRTTLSGRSNVWVADARNVPASRDFHVNGRRAIRARGMEFKQDAALIDRPDLTFDRLIDRFVDRIQQKERGTGELLVYGGYRGTGKFVEMPSWDNIDDVVFIYEVDSTYCVLPVDSVTRSGQFEEVVIAMQMPVFRDAQIKNGVRIKEPNYVENALELLDEPGEWYHDRKSGKLYYIPRPGENMATALTTLSALEELVVVEGTLDDPVRNLCFEGLEFRHSTFLRPDELGHAEIQANFVKNPKIDVPHLSYLKTPGAIRLRNAHGIVFERCRFEKLGTGGLDIESGCRDNVIRDCVFDEIGATAIQVGDVQVEDAHPEDPRLTPRNNLITNNRVANIGTEFKGSVGIFAGYTDGTRITHNEVTNVSYTGISVGWGWGYWDPWQADDVPRYYNENNPGSYPRFSRPTASRNNIIAYNHVHRVLQRLNDGGGIYTLGRMDGSEIKFNHVHDNGGKHGRPGGIYLDEASAGIEVFGNVVYNVAKPFHIHWTMPEQQKTLRVHDNFFDVRDVVEGMGPRQAGAKK